MKTRLALALLLAAPLVASAQIEWRLSVKFILNAQGMLPDNPNNGYGANSVSLTNHTAVRANVELSNQLLDRANRGYRFRLVEIVDVAGVSQWYTPSARDNRAALENDVLRNQALYRYDASAINVYINNSASGQCSFPNDGTIIFAGADAYDTLLIHEIGHFFNLAHTFEGMSACADCATCTTFTPGNGDGMADTLADHTCFNDNDIAMATYGRPLNQLSAAERVLVNDTWRNIMSYHIPQNRFTDDQLDRMADTSNTARGNVATGATWFVAPWGSDEWWSVGYVSFSRFRTLTRATASAGASDIVLLAGGNYNEPMTLNRPMTLRATRGNAVIGRP